MPTLQSWRVYAKKFRSTSKAYINPRRNRHFTLMANGYSHFLGQHAIGNYVCRDQTPAQVAKTVYEQSIRGRTNVVAAVWFPAECIDGMYINLYLKFN